MKLPVSSKKEPAQGLKPNLLEHTYNPKPKNFTALKPEASKPISSPQLWHRSGTPNSRAPGLVFELAYPEPHVILNPKP